jgi:hypothetical protein
LRSRGGARGSGDCFVSRRDRILHQNDDFAKDYVRGIQRERGGDRTKSMIVGVRSCEITDATIVSRIVSLQATGADIFIDISTPRFAAQAIRRMNDTGWRPLHLLPYASAAVAAVMKPAGAEKATDPKMDAGPGLSGAGGVHGQIPAGSRLMRMLR